MQALIDNVVFAGLIHALTAVAALGAALAFLSAVRKNKGAKSNVSVMFLALGCVLLGTVGAILALYDFQLVNVTQWNDLLTLAGLCFLCVGAIYWRRLLGQLSK